MDVTYPHVISSCIGETLIFKQLVKEPDGDKLIVENYAIPGIGPVMHTHWLQDECITVIKGRLGYEIQGQPKKYLGEGETILFEKGVAHRFWNDGQNILHCCGYIKPANSVVFFLSSIFAAQNKAGKAKPEQFDAAYLLTRYKSEFDLTGMPEPVKKYVLPAICSIGKLLGKYPHFKNAPEPVMPAGSHPGI